MLKYITERFVLKKRLDLKSKKEYLLNKFSNATLEDIINYLIKKYHAGLLNDLNEINVLIVQLEKNIYDNKLIHLPKEIFYQLKSQFIEHIKNEEDNYFPLLIKMEQGEDVDLVKIKKIIGYQIQEHKEVENYLKYLLKGRDLLSDMNGINTSLDNIINQIIKLVEKFYNDTVEHVFLEDDILGKKVLKYIEVLEDEKNYDVFFQKDMSLVG